MRVQKTFIKVSVRLNVYRVRKISIEVTNLVMKVGIIIAEIVSYMIAEVLILIPHATLMELVRRVNLGQILNIPLQLVTMVGQLVAELVWKMSVVDLRVHHQLSQIVQQLRHVKKAQLQSINVMLVRQDLNQMVVVDVNLVALLPQQNFLPVVRWRQIVV